MAEYNKEQELQKEIRDFLEKEQAASTAAEKAVNDKGQIELPIEDRKEEVVSGEVKEPVVSETVSKEEYAAKDEWEEKALKMGWKPDHKGENFVEAKEYVLRKPLFNLIDKLKQEQKDIKDKMKTQDEYLATARKEAYEQALRDLEAKREEAVQESNLEQYKRLQSEDLKLRQQMAKDPIINKPVARDPAIVEFEEKNSWYSAPRTSEEQKMRIAAESIDAYLYKQAKVDQGLDPYDMNQRPHIDPKT